MAKLSLGISTITKTILLIMLLSSIQSKLRITSPDSLITEFPEGEVDMNIATFGDIPYGIFLYGSVYYDIDNQDSEMACNPIKTIQIEASNSFEENSSFVLLDRGNCSFVTKARNAQKIGAKVVIIINNTDENIHDIYMIDDGTGKDINISAVLISKTDGEKFKKYYKNNRAVRPHIILDFDFAKSEKVSFEIIMSSTNKEMYSLLKSLKPIIESLGNEKFHFYPIYYIQSHPSYVPSWRRDSSISYKEINSSDCYDGGAYCYFTDSEAINLGIYDGQTVLKEDLRQICIYKERNDYNTSEFIDYTTAFYESCMKSKDPSFNDSCSREAMKSIGYNNSKIEEIENCIKTSFTETNEADWYKSDNTILKREKQFLRRMNVIINPSMIVNKKLIYVSSFKY